MSVPPPPHMKAPAVLAAQTAWEDHYASCAACKLASSIRAACPESRHLHDEWVKASQVAYQEWSKDPRP